GDDEGVLRLQVRPARYVRLVSEARLAGPCERPSARKDSELERLRDAPELRWVLAAAGRRAESRSREGADAERRRLVGSGGFLRTDQDLRDAREERPEASELSRRRPVESWRLERGQRRASRTGPLRFPHVGRFPPRDRGTVVRLLAQEQGHSAVEGGDHLRGGVEHVEVAGQLA